jgi:hypothetical protein
VVEPPARAEELAAVAAAAAVAEAINSEVPIPKPKDPIRDSELTRRASPHTKRMIFQRRVLASE